MTSTCGQANRVSRRKFIKSGIVASATCFGVARASSAASPSIKVDSIEVISYQPQYYHGWPTLTRRRTGELLLVYSGGREAHVCPFGRVELMRSNDSGKTW